jgi:hypothetical protein
MKVEHYPLGDKMFVLDTLGDEELEGRQIREALNAGIPWWKFWQRWHTIDVYFLLAEMEDDEMITRRCVTRTESHFGFERFAISIYLYKAR